ncbi:hypothetical protein [Sphingomonas sp. NFX23]|uniref:hypothetical protein n=1 Tax=Sphingomonas sp. NFX23 TaxID=2819532 RepID=UPI003CE8A1C2
MSFVFSSGFLALIGVMWKTRVPMTKLKLDGDNSLRADLMGELAKQDADHSARVTRLEQRLEDQRGMYEARIEFERVTHASDISTMRHRMNNLDQCLTMLLVLIEENPQKAQEAAKRVREMRAKQEASEAAEKATIAAARITATGNGTP